MDDSTRITMALERIEAFKKTHNLSADLEELLVELRRDLVPEETDEFTFIYFKESGKYYTSAKGTLPRSAFNYRTPQAFHKIVLEYNHNWPGLGCRSTGFAVIVTMGPESPAFGVPLIFPAGSFSD